MHGTVLELVAAHQPLPGVLDCLTASVEGVADGMLASVLLLDADGVHLRHGSAPSLPDAYNQAIDGVTIGPSVGSCGTAAFRREPVVVTDVLRDPLWDDFRELASAHGLRACWSTPILAGDGSVLGTFALYYREPRSPDDRHARIIETATHLARIAIEHDRAEHRVRDAEQKRFIAETLQRALLPDTLPALDGLDVAARYLPGADGMEVGGDWYDVFALPDGRVGVAIGDVAGRGAQAAAAMGELRIALRTVARLMPDPADVVREVSAVAQRDGRFATLVYGVLDPASGRLEVVSAGHPPGIVLAPCAKARVLPAGLNPPLGVIAGTPASTEEHLAPGEVVLLFTDGLVERRAASIDDGLLRLCETAEAHTDDLDAMCDAIVARLGADAVDDDVAMLVLRLVPKPA